MWIGHFASGLVAKPFAPQVPLAVLSLAGALPDVTFFLLQFLGIETFNFDAAIAKRGCFPYSNDYPYSHSLAGMIGFGALLAVLYKKFARVSATSKEMIVIVAASASHFLLEWPVHRADVKIMPHNSTAFGVGLFDSPLATFVLENVVFFAGLWVYRTFAPLASQVGIQNNPRLPTIVAVVMILQQAHFCFGACVALMLSFMFVFAQAWIDSAPTYETRWVHAPAFLLEILGSCYLLGMLDGRTKTMCIEVSSNLKKHAN